MADKDEIQETPTEEVSKTKKTKTSKGTKAVAKKPTKTETEPVDMDDGVAESNTVEEVQEEEFAEELTAESVENAKFTAYPTNNKPSRIPTAEDVKEHVPEPEDTTQITLDDLQEMKKLLQDSLIPKEVEDEEVGRNHQQEIFGKNRTKGKRKPITQGTVAPAGGTIFSGGRWVKG